MALLDQFKHHQTFEPGQVLYNQGDPCEGVYSVREGLVGERRVDSEGRSTLVRLSHPGSTIGYQELLSRTPYRNSAEVLQKSQVCFVGASLVRQLLASSPSLGERFLRRTLEETKELEDALVEARTIGVKGRLLHVLMILHEQCGSRETRSGYAFEIPVTRRDLADLVGATPETISRVVRQLQKEGIAHFDGHHVTIPDFSVVFGEID